MSERAITTAARAAQREAVGRLIASARDSDEAWAGRPQHWRDHHMRVADAIVALVVREEHDRLRDLIDAMPVIRREAVLALLGESTQEQANKEER